MKIGALGERRAPDAVRQINSTCRLLRDTLIRARPIAINETLRKQLVGLMRHWLNQRLRLANTICVSNSQMAKWGECKPRQARANVATLRDDWGALVAVDHQNGGNQSTTYILLGRAIYAALIAHGCNPSDELRAGLQWHQETVPRQPTPAVTPAVAHFGTPAVFRRAKLTPMAG